MRQRGLRWTLLAHSLPLTVAALIILWVSSRTRTGPVFSLAAALTILGLTAFLVLTISRMLLTSLEQVTEGARLFGAGRLDHRLRYQRTREVSVLSSFLNEMASSLERRIQSVTHQTSLVETIFASMAAGILAIDSQGRLIDLNDAAAQELGLSREQALGHTVGEIVRNREILEFVRRAQNARAALEDSLTIYGERERYLQIRGNVLHGADGSVIGALVVFHDVTQLRRLESLRRDFAANVSHELKTPITSIKGFVETLQDGAMKDTDSAGRFLTIIGREADRLAAIVEDLMSLSRVEQREESGGIVLQSARIKDILNDAIQSCGERARERGVRVSLVCADDTRAQLNGQLLQQAVINLIDNAIKYSGAGETVTVRGKRNGDGARISVEDTGCGISAEHLPRLFERFYRVDKARSRSQGGTGLGLAIVKHIAQAHGGSIDVESQVGKGSVFTLRLP